VLINALVTGPGGCRLERLGAYRCWLPKSRHGTIFTADADKTP
jgi:hypothetical protein